MTCRVWFVDKKKQQTPGKEYKMEDKPQYENSDYKGSGKLKDKVAVITGGDSGIGRAVAIAYAKEGCDCAILYLNEHKDAGNTKTEIEALGKQAVLYSGDIRGEEFCISTIDKIIAQFGKIDILVNNAAAQFPQDRIEDITADQLDITFKTNIYSMFYLTKAVLKHLSKGGVIINTTSVTAYRGSAHLLDYSSTKGAIVSFTRSLAANVVERGIRVNAVAPGPVWTPLIPSTFDKEDVESFGSQSPMGRAAQPYEIAPSYVFLACQDSSFMTGQVLHPNGGDMVGG